MQVESILKAKGHHVSTIRPDAGIGIAVRRLKLEKIGAFVVSDDDLAVLGLIAEREIVYGLAKYGAELLERRVADLMSREVMTCRPTDTVKFVMAAMTLHRVRHMPVVDQGKLCGIVSIGDVVKSRLDDLELETSTLRDAYMARP